MRLPVHPWRPTRRRIERLREAHLAQLAAQIPDKQELDAILAQYPEEVRVRVAERLFPYLRFGAPV
jgi:hypothetical protein